MMRHDRLAVLVTEKITTMERLAAVCVLTVTWFAVPLGGGLVSKTFGSGALRNTVLALLMSNRPMKAILPGRAGRGDQQFGKKLPIGIGEAHRKAMRTLSLAPSRLRRG